jgi:hypothetical protein
MALTSIAASLLSLFLGLGWQAPDGERHRLELVGTGRFAVFADVGTIEARGAFVRMRSLQVGEEDLVVAGERYWGGWSWWVFDCAARTADRLDFASVREGGAEGPSTADAAPPYPAAPGGDAAELLAVACGSGPAGRPDADTVSDAVRLGRAALAGAGD